MKNVVEAIKAGVSPLDTANADPMRVAVLLDWAAREYPYEFVPYNYLLKGIRGFKQTPAVGSKDVDRVRSRVAPAKLILMRDFGRTTLSLAGGGVRATVDSMDTAKNVLPSQMRRVQAASSGFIRTRGLVDVRQLPKNAEGEQVKRWLHKTADEAMRVLGAEGFLEKLLAPPAPAEPKE